MTTIKVYTEPGTKASEIGEVYGSFEGVAWRNAVDEVNEDGTGIVFLDLEEGVDLNSIRQSLDRDDAVDDYLIQDQA